MILLCVVFAREFEIWQNAERERAGVKPTGSNARPNAQPGAAKSTRSRDPRPAGGSAGAGRSGASGAGHSAGEKRGNAGGILDLKYAVLNNENSKIEPG